eukprot:GHRR01036815.1.p1 GENE.GHRR01036815.1~~GHRR01036815.1.p1  ORF type:complete len:135 (-),score=25.28 GHRR01036815.1:9-413(-)
MHEITDTALMLMYRLQVLFSWEHTPLFDTSLTLGMRLLYTSVTWSYITNTIAVPANVLVPFIALVFGVYPLVLNRDFALAATLYYCSSSLVTMVSVYLCLADLLLELFISRIAHMHLLWLDNGSRCYGSYPVLL